MKLLSKITAIVLTGATCLVLAATPVKAETGVPSQAVFLNERMNIQIAENAKALEYFQIQEAKAKAENRPISDIEMVKRQALEGMIQGNNNLLQMGNAAIAVGDPYGMGNIALVDQAAYDGFTSGMKAIEEVKKNTWLNYTFRTH